MKVPFSFSLVFIVKRILLGISYNILSGVARGKWEKFLSNNLITFKLCSWVHNPRRLFANSQIKINFDGGDFSSDAGHLSDYPLLL